MFNLTVAEARTFFVGDGAWLVHNCGGGGSQRELPNMPKLQYPSQVTYGTLDGYGRPTFVEAVLQRPIQKAKLGTDNIRHWLSHFNEKLKLDRTHLLARQLGGENRPENLVPFSSKVNQNQSYGIAYYEKQVNAALRGGQTVQMTVKPIYQADDVIAKGIELRAIGSGEHPIDIWVTFINHPFSPHKYK